MAQEKKDAAALEELVAKEDDLEFITEGGRTKVHFKCTGHNEPTRLKLVQEYMKGGKYRKKREWYSADFKQFEPDIVEHKDSAKFLMCMITGTKLPKTLEKVQAHIKSSRFKELKKQQEEKNEKHAAKQEKKKAMRQKLKAIFKAKLSADADGQDGKTSRSERLKLKRSREAKTDDKKADGDKEGRKKKKKAKGKGKPEKKRPERATQGRRKRQFLEGKSAPSAPAAAEGS